MATNATQEAWLRSAPGKAFNPDGAFGLQCVDVADAYAEAIHGVPWGQCFGGGNAAQHFPKNNGYFTSIGWQPGKNRPERGDIIVWGATGSNPYGHIAVVVGSTLNNVSVVQQNYNNGGAANTPTTQDVMPYEAPGVGRCVGWLRPNVPGATVPDPGEIVMGNAGPGGTATAAPIRQKNQRWAKTTCAVLDAPRPNARKTGEIHSGDLVTMDGYVLGEWHTWEGEGSSFWFKVSAAGQSGGRSGMDWDKLCQLEASGNWACNTGNGYYGGLQFLPSTWRAFGGTKYAANAHLATREQQIEIGEAVLAGQGVKAWPVNGPKCYTEGGGGSSEMHAVDGYASFVYFDPLETYGVPDKTPYETWTTVIPDPPKLDANAPEAHWDGNVWVGWQWNHNKTEVVWVTPSGDEYSGAYIQAGGTVGGGAYPEPIPMGGPVRPGDVSTGMWNYLQAQGWGPLSQAASKDTSTIYLSVTYHEMTGGYVPANTAALGAWYWLQKHGWQGIPGDGSERLYAPSHPRYSETRRVVDPVPVPIHPVLPGSDVTDHVGQLLVAAGWKQRTVHSNSRFIVAPEKLNNPY